MGIAAGRLSSGVAMVFAGQLADRIGARRVAVAGCLLTALGVGLTGISRSPLQLMLAWGLIGGIGVALAFTVVLDKAVMFSFPPAQRGRAIGFRFAAIGFSSFFATIGAGWLAEQYSWRVACFVWSALLVFAAVFLARMVPDTAGVARPPANASDKDLSPLEVPSVSAIPHQGATLRFAFGNADFWRIALVASIQSGVQTGIVIHLAVLLTDAGLSVTRSTVLLGSMVLLGIPGRLGAGIWADRLGSVGLSWVLTAALVVQVLPLAVFAAWPTGLTAVALPVLYGLAGGVPVPALILMQTRMFGVRHFGSIQGSILLGQAMASVIAPVGLGVLYDMTGHYTLALLACCLALMAAAVLTLTHLRTADLRRWPDA